MRRAWFVWPALLLSAAGCALVIEDDESKEVGPGPAPQNGGTKLHTGQGGVTDVEQGGRSSSFGEPADTAPPSIEPVTDPESGKLKGITRAHNQIRALTDTAEPLPPLVWDAELAQVAQAHAEELAETCAFQHSMSRYGENLARFGTTVQTGPDATGVSAVTNWAREIDCYSYGPFMNGDQCTSACDDSGGCGHYTQLVWRATQRVGCGVASCKQGQFYYDTYVCNYDPPGNFIGQEPY